MAVNVRQRKLPSGDMHWQTDIRVRLPDGTLYRERLKAPGKTRGQALRWARQREAHILRHGRPGKESNKDKRTCPTLAEFRERFMTDYVQANRLKHSTQVHWRQIWSNYLIPILGDKRLDKIGSAEIQRFKRQPVAPTTLNLQLKKLGTVLRTAREWGLIDEVPAIKRVKEAVKPPKFYDFGEYKRLLASARSLDSLAYIVVLLGGDAGLRTGEIIALRWCDVDLERGVLSVTRNVCRGHEGTPKGGRTRQLPMTPRLKQALTQHERRGERVLLRKNGEMISAGVVECAMYRSQRKAGLPKTGAHILRHTFCSHLAMRGAAPRAIQRLAGHAKYATTDKYMHLAPQALLTAIDLLDAGEEDEE